MPAAASGTLIGRRLDRLRAAGEARSSPTTPPAAHAAAPSRLEALAAGVGGLVCSTPEGPFVVLQCTVEAPFDPVALSALPYDVPRDGPLVFLDLETTGLGTAAGTVPFLIGLGVWRDGTMRVSQLLLPDHSLETALLSTIAALVPADAWLVTYNGRSFDWPLLVSRFRLHRRAPPQPAGHLDLLPVARQLWKHRLGSARLATVEALAGVRRWDDLPGALVPERYFTYLRDGNPSPLRPVLRHNLQDIKSLALLIGVLAADLGPRDRWPDADPGDLAGLARAFSRRGRLVDALDCVDVAIRRVADPRPETSPAADGALRRRLLVDRARLRARSGRHAEAAEDWLELARSGGPGAVTAWLWLARHHEHRSGDLGAALEACLRATNIAERGRAMGRPMTAVELDLRRRMPRLRRRLARQRGPAREDRRRAA